MTNYQKIKTRVFRLLAKDRINATQGKGNTVYRLTREQLADILTDGLLKIEIVCENPTCKEPLEGYRQKYCSDKCQRVNKIKKHEPKNHN
jgi:hypothetical protein